MKRRVLSLIVSGLLVFPMVGCNANLSVCGKEIFNFNDTQIEQPVQPKQHEEYQEAEAVKDDILARLLTGEYTLYINENEYVYNTEEVLKALYDGNPQYKIERYAGTQYFVQVSDVSGKNFITFLVDEIEEDIAIVEFNHNGEFFEGQDASDSLSYVIYSELFNEEDATLTKKHHTTKEETKKEQSSKKEENTTKNEKKYNCLWCNGSMNQYQYDTYGGCCSELCAVQYEGMIYENAEKNGEVGGQTLCGWCHKAIPDDQCFCSKECKNMHEEYYNN